MRSVSPALHLVSLPRTTETDPAPERVIIKPKARMRGVVEFIRSARRSLLLSIFRCDDLIVLHELAEAVGRGVKVEVLVTGRAKGWGRRLGPLAGCLERMGVLVHRFPGKGMKYHAKYMLADEETALISTGNLTRKCLHRTRDFLLITRDSAIVSGLVTLFRADSQGTAVNLGGRLIVGPGDSRERIEQVLGSAQTSIRILDHKLSDAGILALLRDRQRKGVTVEIERGELPDSLQAHGRLIVVDHSTAVFGSFALSERSLNERRELAVVIEDAGLVGKLERQFESSSREACAAVEAAA